MKKILFFLAIITLTAAFTFNPFNEIIDALGSGNSAAVASYFDNTVEITKPEKSGVFNKEQAELELHDFFSVNSIKKFEVIHKSENSGSQYCIGNLFTNNGLFRTTIFMKQKGDKLLIQELRFEK